MALNTQVLLRLSKIEEEEVILIERTDAQAHARLEELSEMKLGVLLEGLLALARNPEPGIKLD
jgi:hypothetical protein